MGRICRLSEVIALDLLSRFKGLVSYAILSRIAEAASSSDESSLSSLFSLISRIAPASYQRELFRRLARMAEEGHPLVELFGRAFREMGDRPRRAFVLNFLVNFLVLSRGVRDRWKRELGFSPPCFLVISPTMRCNLRCRGCYAGMYPRDGELTLAELDELLAQAKELGIYFFTVSGGEPFLREDLLELFRRHEDCYFQVYTNGTLIDEGMAEELARLGNVAPMISIEGTPEETEMRRGPGSYGRVLEAMEVLRRKGVLFGFSATCTRSSADYLSSDEFLDSMIERGCKVGWFFQYIPTGLEPDPSYMATPEQRARLREKVERWRSTRPIFLGDFWNDGPYVDGCMAGGRRYLHVTSSGDVEPCVFVHFAVDNVREKPLLEILKSPFFRAIREAQPFDDDNLLRPCMIVDHPWVLRDLVRRFGARPTHPGAERLLSELAPALDEYAHRLRSIYDPIWEREGRERYVESLSSEDDPEVWLRMERRCPGGYAHRYPRGGLVRRCS